MKTNRLLGFVCLGIWAIFAAASPVAAAVMTGVVTAGIAITPESLRMVAKGVSKTFNDGLAQLNAKDAGAWRALSMEVPSMSASELYPYLKSFSSIREWVGDRVVTSLGAATFEVFNKPYEKTIGIQRTAIQDDKLGLYKPNILQMSQDVYEHPHRNVVSLLNQANSIRCYDGQWLCDVDHPYLQANGTEAVQSNWAGGSDEIWFLASTKRLGLKPFIVQTRQDFEFHSMTDMSQDRPFMRNEFLFGVDGRFGFAPGVWQLIYGSRQPLTVANYEAARAAFMGIKRDGGDVLGLIPDTLIVGRLNEGKGRDIVLAKDKAGGGSNTWAGTVDLMVFPELV